MRKHPIKTHWIVFDGAPSTGKSTAWRAFRRAKFVASRPEVGRKYVRGELAKGRTLEEIVANKAALSYGIAAGMEAAEILLPRHELVFMDRAMPCCMSYCLLHGLDLSPVMAPSQRFKYAMIFLFDRLPIKRDGVRHENEEQVDFLDRQLEIDYRSLGYEPIRVPVASREQRALFITSEIIKKLWNERSAKHVVKQLASKA